MTIKVKELVNRWKLLLAGVVALVLFFSVRSCVNTQSSFLQGKIASLEEQVGKSKDGLKVAETERLRLKDSIRLEDIKAKEKLKNLQEQKVASEDRVKLLELEAKKAKEKVKDMNLVQVASTLNEIYGGNNATATSNSVETKNSLPYQLVETAIENNSAQDIIKEKNQQLVNRDSVISVKDSQIKSSALNLFSAEKSLQASRELNQLQTNLNTDLEKQNKKLKTKNLIDKIIIPVAAVAGFLIGSK